MKHKFSKILGVGLSLMLLVSLLVSATPVSASDLNWGEVSPIHDEVENLMVADSDVTDLAINGDIIFAATSVNATPLFKSVDGGKVWVDLSPTTDFPTNADGTFKAVKLVAVAPDDAKIVMIATTDNVVYHSDDGGQSWEEIGMPAGATEINDIDVSEAVEGINYAAAAGKDAADAEMWSLKLSMAETWQPRAGGSFRANQTRVSAVQFSPNFETDKVITCVSGNATGVTFQVFRCEKDAYTWNGAITYFAVADWGTGVVIPAAELDNEAAISGGLVSASIALVPEYLGTEAGERIAFVGVAGGTGGGAVRLSDAYVKEVQTWAAGPEGRVRSVAYGNGKLLVGAYDASSGDARVYRCLEPMATEPRLDRLNDLKQPGGENLVVAGWSGTKAVAGTSGDESAFAVSTDDGYSFSDTGLIDCEINYVDLATSADNKKVYLTSYDGDDASVWLFENKVYTRVLSLKDQDTDEEALRIGIAPENPAVVYVSAMSSQDMWMSKDSGMAKWKHVPCYKVSAATGIQDFVVESADVVYAIDRTSATKTTNGGASWGTEKSIEIDGYMITLAPNNDVLVGGYDGYASFSKDGGQTFTKILDIATNPTNADYGIHIVADDDYATNGLIYYAAVSTDDLIVERAKVGKTETWTSRNPEDDEDLPSATTGFTGWVVTGMAQAGDITYVLIADDDEGSRLYRALYLETADTGHLAEWSWTGEGGESFGYNTGDAPLQIKALKMAGATAKGPTFEAVCASSKDERYSILDTIATLGPTLTSPAAAFAVPLNPETGKAYDVTFVWQRYPSKYVDQMTLQIASDADFAGLVYEMTFVDIVKDAVSQIVGPTGTATVSLVTRERVKEEYTIPSYTTVNTNGENVTIPAILMPETIESYQELVSTSRQCDFMPGTTYYWRTRIEGTTEGDLISAWSAPGSFKVDVAKPVEAPTINVPETKIPEIKIPTITIPEIKVPEAKVTVNIPPAEAAIPTWMLWIIIVIGAVLVIAVIILIVRTRRVP